MCPVACKAPRRADMLGVLRHQQILRQKLEAVAHRPGSSLSKPVKELHHGQVRLKTKTCSGEQLVRAAPSGCPGLATAPPLPKQLLWRLSPRPPTTPWHTGRKCLCHCVHPSSNAISKQLPTGCLPSATGMQWGRKIKMLGSWK